MARWLGCLFSFPREFLVGGTAHLGVYSQESVKNSFPLLALSVCTWALLKELRKYIVHTAQKSAKTEHMKCKLIITVIWPNSTTKRSYSSLAHCKHLSGQKHEAETDPLASPHSLRCHPLWDGTGWLTEVKKSPWPPAQAMPSDWSAMSKYTWWGQGK